MSSGQRWGTNINSYKQINDEQLLKHLIEEAIRSNATFIHIEPRNPEILVRYRINGSLVEFNRFTIEDIASLSEELRNLADIQIGLAGMPEDGKFQTIVNDRPYSFKVTILPTIDGEKISIGLSENPKSIESLEKLGYWGEGLKSIKDALTYDRGVILLNGPGDSGKSLSLVSMLSAINDPDVKISTIEDPIEYEIQKANQTQVNYRVNLTFANGLQTIEKHNPDVIMVSELRDSETANLVFQYGMKNNLILTSMHSKSSYESIDRLVKNGIKRPLIAHSLKIISSQRLVRRLCDNCRVSFAPDKYTIALINNIFGLPNPKKMKYINKLESMYLSEINHETPKASKLNTTGTKIKKIYMANKEGCDKCYRTGYKGQIGLYETIHITDSIQKLILSLASPKVLMSRATAEGTTDLLIDGLIKALAGQTSIHEVFRVHQNI